VTITLYELCGREDRRFSPYCWRTRLALAHKGLNYETVPIRFCDKNLIAFSDQDRVPVIRDGDRVVNDSWSIACYLEDSYPDRPSLFGGGAARAMTRFFNAWTDNEINFKAVPLVVKDVYEQVDDADRDYFLESREQRFGMSLDTLHAARDDKRSALQAAFAPARAIVQDRAFFAGDAPAYADYILMGTLQWLRLISGYRFLEPDDPILAWRARMLDRLGPVLSDVAALDS
jgi:glutathione S-transferase